MAFDRTNHIAVGRFLGISRFSDPQYFSRFDFLPKVRGVAVELIVGQDLSYCCRSGILPILCTSDQLIH